MKNLALFVAFYFLSNDLLAQAPSIPSFFHCGTDALHTALQNSDPAYAAQEQAREAAYREAASGQKKGAGSGVLTLPVVVHIVHDNGPENISDAQVLKGIAWLNDAFRNRNYFNPATGVDTEIEFCLAQRDLAGKAFSGIARYPSLLTDMSLNLGKPSALTHWDTKNYINIILVREACLFGNCSGVAGFATFPGTHGEPNEGIVMEARYFGTSAAEATVLAHEMGHYLGLFHTFQGGCENDNCLTDGDRVCDTPPDNSSGYFPCDAQINSCSTDADDASPQNPFRSPALGGMGDQPDQYRNYMDYALYACRDRFTEGQKQRMRFFVEGIRAALLSSKACLPPCPLPVVAQFATDPSAVEAGGTVTVSNQSLHAAAYRWYLDGQLVSTDPAPVLTLLSAGSHVLRLEAESALAACEVGSAEKTIEVSCPVASAFDYVVQGTRLIFSDQSAAADSLLWTLKNGSGKVLAQSKAPADTFDLSGLQYVQLCLLAQNAYCSQSSCVDIPLVGSGVEICDNALDDDKDGLTDRFDPDCPCDTAYFQAYCPVDCEYVPNPDRKFVLKLKWTSDVISDYSTYISNVIVGDIDDDGNIEVLAPKCVGNSALNNIKNNIMVFNNINGDTEQDFTFTPLGNVYFSVYQIAIADVDGDGKAEIFSPFFNTILCFSHDGNLLWQSDPLKDQWATYVNLADFNADGIPEIYIGNEILNARTGKLLVSGSVGEGCNKRSVAVPNTSCSFKHTIAADLLPTPGLELAAGNTVYQVTINNPNGTIGNLMTPVMATGPVTDGLTSVGDINGDGQLDVVVVKDKTSLGGGGIWVWDPRTRATIASAPAGLTGGVAFIGNVQGDCKPEIGMTFEKELRMYQYDGSPQLKLLYSLPTTDGSGFTGITMFDFNQDGEQELVYRDETALRILEGATGITLASYPIKSGTGMEYPVVADVDKDGHAEILVNGYQSTNPYDYRVYCFESGAVPWAPARSVWNQYGYHVTNVNDDLTIPRHQQNPAQPLPGYETCLQPTCPAPYNAFMAQATYRTQQGCVQFPAVDLDLKILRYECTPDSLIFYLVLRNLSQNPIGENCVNVSCYPTDPYQHPPGQAPQFNPLETNCIPILAGSALNDTIRLAALIPPGVTQMYFFINDAGKGAGAYNHAITGIVECNYANNMDFVALDLAPRSLYLGPDLVKCASAVTTLNAGAGFTSYLWSDGTQDSIYSSAAAGLHVVEATDRCGRIYRDTVLVIIDPVGGFDLGPDVSACRGEALHFDIAGTFEQVQWVPATQVSCADCPGVTVTPDTSFSLIAVAGTGSCYTADTVQIQVAPSFLLKKTAQTCHVAEVGSDTLFLKTVFGCDSLIVTATTLSPSFLLEKTALTCQLTEVGSDTIFLKTAFGCDSLIVTATTLSPSFLTEKTALTCQLAEVGTDTIFLETAFGCDSLIVTATALSPSFLAEKTAQTCLLAEVGSDTLFLKTAFGCDSLIVTATALSPSFLTEKTALTCQLAEVGTDTVFLKTAFGCDSLIVTTTTLSPSFLTEKTALTCQLAEVGTDTVFLKTAFGCDSLIVTATALSPSFLTEKTALTCQLAEVGSDTIFLKTAFGCDSLIVSTTTLSPSFLVEKTALTCQLAEVGTDTVFLKTAFGCDSLIITATTLSPSFLVQKTAQTCQLAEVGTDTVFLKTAFGCDSLIVTATALSPSFLVEKTALTCQLTEVGTDTVFLKTAFGCDSLIVTATTLSPSFLVQKTAQTCQLAEVGTDTVFLKTAFGCDSLIVTATALSPSFLVEKTALTCQLAEVGTDTVFLKTAFGCDSLIVTATALSPIVSVDLGLPPAPLEPGGAYAIPLTISHQGQFDYAWSPPDGLSCIACPDPVARPLQTTTYTLLLTDANGCTFLDSLTLRVQEAIGGIYVPNALTLTGAVPNGQLTVYAHPAAAERVEWLRVYDRWGGLMFEGQGFAPNDESAGWDGTWRGRRVQPGVYLWQAEIRLPDGSLTRKSGDVTVVE